WAMIGSSALGDSTSSVARNTSTIGSPSQLPTTPPVRIAAAIAIHASPSVFTSIRTGTKTSVMRLVPMGSRHLEWVVSPTGFEPVHPAPEAGALSGLSYGDAAESRL